MRTTRRSCVIASAFLLVLSAGVNAAPPSLSGPSSLTLGSRAQFGGINYAPYAPITVVVTDPSGSQHSQSLVASASGTVRYELNASIPGQYQIQVIDRNGALLQKLTLPVRP